MFLIPPVLALWLACQPWFQRLPWADRMSTFAANLFVIAVALLICEALRPLGEAVQRAAGTIAQRAWRNRVPADPRPAGGHEKHGGIMITDSISITVKASERDDILHYASYLLERCDRQPDAVIATAGPLLEWASAAADNNDLYARMRAMAKTHNNGMWLRSASTDPKPARLSPDEFVANARAYYHFITGKAA